MGKGMKELRFSWTEGRLLSLMTTPVVMMIILISIFFIVIITVMMMTWGRLLCICFAHLHRLPLLQNAAAATLFLQFIIFAAADSTLGPRPAPARAGWASGAAACLATSANPHPPPLPSFHFPGSASPCPPPPLNSKPTTWNLARIPRQMSKGRGRLHPLQLKNKVCVSV